MRDYRTTSILDLGRLASRAVGTVLRRPRSFDPNQLLHDWMRDMIRRYGANVFLNLGIKRMLLVTDREVSRHILAANPASTGYTVGTPKRKAMSYLAPQALTIAEDSAWQRLRPFNERVLCAGRPHNYQRVFFGQVVRAFSVPIASVEDIRRCMGQAMLGIVFGEGVAPSRLGTDIQVLFGLVQNPLKRLLRGGRERRRVKGLYDNLRQVWQDGDGPVSSLLGMAREAGGSNHLETLLQQVPHWMFTFSGSGSDMLSRGLAMIGSRPEVLARARQEVADAGSLLQPGTVDGLQYLEACLLESARLFPPVKATFHRAAAGDLVLNTRIPAGTEIVQVFSLTQRDRESDPTADTFQPERWLGSNPQAEAAYPNIFLSGARACPGRDLILFVCKAAAAVLVYQSGLVVHSAQLAQDPVPFTFPRKGLRFKIARSSEIPLETRENAVLRRS